MNIVLFLLLLAILNIGYFILGIYASKGVQTTTDYFLAGRNLGLWPVTFTLIATQLGGGMLLGTSQQAYTVGLYGILYSMGMCLGFLLLGMGFAARLQSLQVSTVAELFETRYGSARLKKVASLFSIITFSGILIAQMVASKTVLVGLGITSDWIYCIFWMLIIIYTMTGGLKAVVITDIYQAAYILMVFGAIFIYCFITGAGSFSFLTCQIAFCVSSLNINSLIATVMMPMLFSLFQQDLAQRFFASRSARVAALSALSAGVCLLLFSLIPIYFGIQAKLLQIPIADNASPLIPTLSALTNDIILAFALCGIIAAISSTATSLLCAISSNLAQDFDITRFGTSNRLRSSQIITLLIGVVLLGASYIFSTNIINILVESYELSVVCLLVPLIVSYYKSGLNKNAAIGAIACGLFGFIIFRIIPIPFPKEIASLLLSCMGFVIGNKIK